MRIAGGPGKIEISTNENRAVKENNTETYDSKILGLSETFIDDFKGDVAGFKSFEVENISGEQLYMLYPVNNSGEINVFENVALDAPYDAEGENLDNILNTIEIK